MAARCLKGGLNLNPTSSALINTRGAFFRGQTTTIVPLSAYKRPAVRTIADNKRAKDPRPAPPVQATHHNHPDEHNPNHNQHQACNCPDCRWFPFHKPQGSKFLPLLFSDAARDKIHDLIGELIVHTPVISGNPLEPPTNFALYYHLPGRRGQPLHERVALLNEDLKSDAAAPAGEDDGAGKNSGKGGNDEDDMARSGYDTSRMQAGQDKRRADGNCSSSGGRDAEQKKNDDQAPKEVGHESPAQEAPEGRKEGEEKGKKGDPSPSKKDDDEISPMDQRIPLEGRGWTFWL